jgi:hypothetical protein
MATKDLRELEERCRRRVADLDASGELGRIACVDDLCARVAERRQRPIHLEASPMPATLAGAWLASDHADYIFFAQDAPPPHQEHIKLHELAHILCEHRPITDQAELLHEQLFGRLDPRIIRSMLARSRYDTRQEREAELVASLIEQRWFARRSSATSPSARRGEAGVAGRLDAFAAKLRT